MEKEKLYKDRDWLEEQYVEKGLTLKEIGEKVGKTLSTIHYWVKKLNLIPSEDSWEFVICEQCGEEFRKPQSKVSKFNLCSLECQHKWLEQGGAPTGEDHPNYSKKEVQCANCGKEFKVKKNRFENNKNFFCSYNCHHKWLDEGWIWAICEQCGEYFLRKVFEYRRSDNHFCSDKCHQEFSKGKQAGNWKGGYDPYYGPNWREQRNKVLNRDNFSCQKCDALQELVVHHKIPMRIFKKRANFDNEKVDWEEANKLDNLITLCRSCHKEAEDNEDFFN